MWYICSMMFFYDGEIDMDLSSILYGLTEIVLIVVVFMVLVGVLIISLALLIEFTKFVFSGSKAKWIRNFLDRIM